MDPNYHYGLPENNTNFFFMGIIQVSEVGYPASFLRYSASIPRKYVWPSRVDDLLHFDGSFFALACFLPRGPSGPVILQFSMTTMHRLHGLHILGDEPIWTVSWLFSLSGIPCLVSASLSTHAHLQSLMCPLFTWLRADPWILTSFRSPRLCEMKICTRVVYEGSALGASA